MMYQCTPVLFGCSLIHLFSFMNFHETNLLSHCNYIFVVFFEYFFSGSIVDCLVMLITNISSWPLSCLLLSWLGP